MVTAQETPETGRAFQQDLYKKMVSADDLAARRPYGYITRMLRVVGWKRIETNHVMTFRNVLERNFTSIFRRSLVWEPKPVFVDSFVLREAFTRMPTRKASFRRIPTLRAFLESGPAIAASLQLQHGFEQQYSRLECARLIDDCAQSGLTEQKMRAACGLRPREAWLYFPSLGFALGDSVARV